jgi:hypothetical protein
LVLVQWRRRLEGVEAVEAVGCSGDLEEAVVGSVRWLWEVVVQVGRWCLVVKVVEVEREKLRFECLGVMRLGVKEVGLKQCGGQRRWFLEGEVARQQVAYLALVVVERQPYVLVVVVVELMGRK